MSCRAGFIWDAPQHFNRYIEDCGIVCELITPYMLATPFFRGLYNCLIIPTGFGNPVYSRLLPALRSSSPRIKKFVQNGGHLLVFGAAIDRENTYDWLPFLVTYHHECHPRRIDCSSSSIMASLVADYDPEKIECDGIFHEHGGDFTGNSDEGIVLLEKSFGSGRIIVTSIHEFPSRAFLTNFCLTGTQTLF
jgi:hypothetical protein